MNVSSTSSSSVATSLSPSASMMSLRLDQQEEISSPRRLSNPSNLHNGCIISPTSSGRYDDVLPSIKSPPYIPSNMAKQAQQFGAGNVQYIARPANLSASSSSNTRAVPVLVVPHINQASAPQTNASANTSNGGGQSYSLSAHNTARIAQILYKKQHSKEPLSNQENEMLAAAINSAQQQFLFWYQQQALRQSMLSNAANMPTPIHVQATQQLQQLQRLHAIQQQQQQQQMQQQQQQQQISTASFPAYNSNTIQQSPRKESYASGVACENYFDLPDPLQLDHILRAPLSRQKRSTSVYDDELVSIAPPLPLRSQPEQEQKQGNHLSFRVRVADLGVFEYGEPMVENTGSSKRIAGRSKQTTLYHDIGVTDIADKNCGWLIRDLMRSQSELKGHDLQQQQTAHVSLRIGADRRSGNVSRKEFKLIKREMLSTPCVPRTSLYTMIYDAYCRDSTFVQVSDLESSTVQIEMKSVRELEPVDSHPCNSALWRHLQQPTLEFINLCKFMQDNFEVDSDTIQVDSDKQTADNVFHKIARKLSRRPNRYRIPCPPHSPNKPLPSPCSSVCSTTPSESLSRSPMSAPLKTQRAVVQQVTTPHKLEAHHINIASNGVVRVSNVGVQPMQQSYIASPFQPHNSQHVQRPHMVYNLQHTQSQSCTQSPHAHHQQPARPQSVPSGTNTPFRHQAQQSRAQQYKRNPREQMPMQNSRQKRARWRTDGV